MHLTYLDHARKRMRQRSVSEADVEHALKNYVQRTKTPKNSIMYQGPGTDGRTLKVWVFPDRRPDADKTVKSVAWKDER